MRHSGISERSQPAADPGVVRPRGRGTYRSDPTVSTCVTHMVPDARRVTGPVMVRAGPYSVVVLPCPLPVGATTRPTTVPARRAATAPPHLCEGRAR